MNDWHSYTTDIIDPETGLVLFHDVECEIEIDAEFDEAVGITMSITGVRMLAEESGLSRRKRMKEIGLDRLPTARTEWINVMRSKLELHRQIAAYVIAQAEEDDDLAERLMTQEGIYLVSRGWGDPDAHYRRASA